MANKKIPSEWGKKLAKLHDLVMELQEEFASHKYDLEDQSFDDDIDDFLGENDNSQEYWDKHADLLDEVEYICDKLEDLEADTSELDCEYNDYGY